MSDHTLNLVAIGSLAAVLIALLAIAQLPPVWWHLQNWRRRRQHGGYLS